jgi:hypothetical protein
MGKLETMVIFSLTSWRRQSTSPRPSFPISVRPVEILTLPFTPPRPFKGRQIDTLSQS